MNTFEAGKPAPYFCPACEAVPRAGYCNLAGCPTAPQPDHLHYALANLQDVTDKLDALAISHEDACRLSRVFCAASDLRTSQDQRINEWLKAVIAGAVQ